MNLVHTNVGTGNTKSNGDGPVIPLEEYGSTLLYLGILRITVPRPPPLSLLS